MKDINFVLSYTYHVPAVFDICMIQEFLREQLNLLDVDNDFFVSWC